MNKWIILFATILMAIGFSSTIKTTLANPSGSNLIISGVLALSIIAGLWIFSKSDKKKAKKEYDGLQPAN